MKSYFNLVNLTILINIFLVMNLMAQDKNYRNKYEFGVGVSLMGTGDITTISLVNEFDHLVSKRFELSINLGFGKGLPRTDYLPLFSSSLFQLNFNGLFLPLVKGRYKLKVGTGVSLINLNQVGTSIGHREPNGVYVVDEYSIQKYTTLGYNLLIENEIVLFNNISGSILLFGQFYRNNNTNAGGSFKIGYNF